jgi:hypothetical protein
MVLLIPRYESRESTAWAGTDGVLTDIRFSQAHADGVPQIVYPQIS